MADATISKVPDIWYDLFARLLPGTAFVAIILFKFALFPPIEHVSSALWILIAGYLVGHFVQPVSNILTSVADRITGAHDLKKQVQPVYPADSREMLVLSKQYAESSGMCALAFLVGLAVFAEPLIGGQLGLDDSAVEIAEMRITNGFGFAASIAFFLFGIERSYSQRNRCLRYLQSPTYKALISDP